MKLENSFHKSPKNAYTYHWISSGISFLIELLLLGALYVMWKYFTWYQFIICILVGLLVLSIIRLVLQPYIRFNYRYYRVENNNLETKAFFIFKNYKIIKIERLQYLELKTNPILKKLKLNKIVAVTAGHEITLPMVTEQEAEKLANDIFIELRGADTDV